MSVHFLFVEPTAQISDWRMVEVQQRLIMIEVQKA